ncbi:MAG: sigma-70 family RNA polymerase sigma factor [Proteobacteria bacterium]|nr:sigma-70 family RNA polymerase sigma factor [Pseudomonadota bacterium]
MQSTSNASPLTVEPLAEVPATADLWQAFHQRLNAFLRSRVGSVDVDDIEQEVFLRIHKSLQGGLVPRDISGWVHSIARNAVIDHYRRRGASPIQTQADPNDARVDEQFEELDSEGTLAELGRCVRPMVDALSEPYRSAIVMTAFEGLSQVDAASRVGVSVSGMKSRVQRGRKMLAAELLSCCQLQFDARGAPMDCDSDGC